MVESTHRSLAIETSARVGSIALAQNDRVLVEEQFEHGLQHAAQIIPIIDRLTRSQRWSADAIEHVYVSAGPGSFTGLRIGITLAKTLALATGARLVSAPTARVLVENAPPGARHVILVLDAKRDQIFTARFERQSDRWIEREPAHLDSLTAMLERAPRPVHLLGEGIPYHRKFLREESGIILASPELWRPRAAVVATIGAEFARADQFADPDRLAPIYVRKPEAEEKWDATQPRVT